LAPASGMRWVADRFALKNGLGGVDGRRLQLLRSSDMKSTSLLLPREQRNMNAQAISSLHVKLPPAKGLFLFRSTQQARSAMLGLTALAIVLGIVVAADVQMDPDLLRSTLSGAAAGGIGGILSVLVSSFEAEFRWTTRTPSARVRAYDSVSDWLASLGYAEDGHRRAFYPTGPKWLFWDVNFVTVTPADDGIHIRGPWMLLRMIRKRALRALHADRRTSASTPVAP
jgi:hypothetical protein